MNLIQSPIRKSVLYFSRIRFVQSAIVEQADLSAFRQRPDLKVISGVSAIALSYVIGWPLISVLGIAAVHYGNAAIVAIGGPVAYGLSHLVFMLGMYLAGAKYSHVFMRWAVARGMIRLLQRYHLPMPPPPAPTDIGMVAGYDEHGGCHGTQHTGSAHARDQGHANGQAQDQSKG